MDELSQAEAASFEIVKEICSAMGQDMEPVAQGVQSGYLQVEIAGDAAADTFGKHGKSLDALQYLTNLVIARKSPGGARILLDAGGYRERREQALIQLAEDIAAQVKERQEECELDPLPPHERRIIHQVISQDPDLITYSEGEEPDRRLVIGPK